MGNSFVHMELSTGDVAAAKKFYKKVFDWSFNDNPQLGGYTLIDTGDKKTGGGINKKMMRGQPTAWLVYAEVDSVKKTMGKAEKAGAKSVVSYQPIGEMGAIGVFVDPTGAHFGIWERNKAAKPAKKKAGKR